MKIGGKIIGRLFVGFLLSCSLASKLQSQTNPSFTRIQTTPENAIQLFWASTSNEVYEIDYADALVDTNTGNTTWNELYSDYPSQGTNTFIGDFGNYSVVPFITNPNQSPMRFYRVLDKGPSSSDIPAITVTSITNGATLSGQVVVTLAVMSDMQFVTTALYVDGQKMDSSDDGSNYIINTCEWLNGSHVVYGTVKTQSTLSGPDGSYPIEIGRNASPFVNVTFNNLISEVAFSQPYFEPSLGQTQQVTANFAANSDWTLQIVDDSSNVVRTVTGSGNSLLFNWDGTGDGETNIADGVYYYNIFASTNGGASLGVGSGSGSGGGGSPPLPGSSYSMSIGLDSLETWAVPKNGSGNAVPLALYPPGFDTEELTVFSASRSEMQMAVANETGSSSGGSDSPYSGPSSQGTTAPTRNPTSSVKNSVGNVGVAFFSHTTTNTYNVPLNGLQLAGNGGRVKIEDSYSPVENDPIPEAGDCANNFVAVMRKKGWWGEGSFNLSGSTIHVNDLRRASLGGNEIFGQVNIGLFIDHGEYGTSMDYHSDANQSQPTYLMSDNPSDASAPWLRLTEFGTGGNLRWMAILACNSLRNQNYSSMLNHGVLPINSNLHLLCGCSTIAAVGPTQGQFWAEKMTRSALFGGPETVKQAWYDSAREEFGAATNLTGDPIVFHVVGQDNCMDDTLKSYQSTTSGSIIDDHSQVWP